MKNARFLAVGLIVVAILSRFIPHPFNFTAVGASALLAGYAFKFNFRAFLIPISALWISDLVINNSLYASSYSGFTFFTHGAWYIYGAFALAVVIGTLIKSVSFSRVASSAVISAVLFFLVTNFAVWMGSVVYPQNVPGLITAYMAGVPFLINDVLGTVLYSLILFGIYESYLASQLKKDSH